MTYQPILDLYPSLLTRSGRMSNLPISSEVDLIKIDRVYDNNIVGFGEADNLKYSARDAKTANILAYIAVGKVETIIYYPRVISLNNSIRVINAWARFNNNGAAVSVH